MTLPTKIFAGHESHEIRGLECDDDGLSDLLGKLIKEIDAAGVMDFQMTISSTGNGVRQPVIEKIIYQKLSTQKTLTVRINQYSGSEEYSSKCEAKK